MFRRQSSSLSSSLFLILIKGRRRTSYICSILLQSLNGPSVKLYSSMPIIKNTQTSNLINEFATHCYQFDLPRAMKALESMQTHRVFADCVTYAQLIKCCIARGAVEDGKLVHRHVFSDGYDPKTFLINTLLNMYVKFGMMNEAEMLFDEMPERNVISWTTLIGGYSNRPSFKKKALKLLVLMLGDGVMPNRVTYSSVLRACDSLFELTQIHSSLLMRGLESDVFVLSALIDSYCKWGEVENALCVFNEMGTRDSIVWNSIIGGFAQNSDGERALHHYIRMKRAGFQADQSTLTSVLRACTALALLEVGSQVHVHVLKYNQDLILNNALLDMYCKCGSLDDANQTFTRMADKDVISWSTMIIGFAQNGFSRKALELFEAMKVSRFKPNYITMLGVLFACSHAGLVEDGQNYFQSMKKLYGIDPQREHYGCMVDLLGRAGRLDDATRLINEMDCKPDVITWRTLLGACRVHRNTDLAVYAAEQVLNLDPDDSGTYILLSNIYANSQRWEDVAKVRKSMSDLGVNKEPGCSWVEVDKQIHTFIMRDKSHPQIEEITMELKKIIQKLKGVGYVPDTNFVLQDLEGEQKEDMLLYHSEKLAITFGLMNSPQGKPIRIRKNLRICGDCHLFAKLLAKMESRYIVIRDPIRYHHFQDGLCSCGDYW